jgi:hypothetical protein
VLDQFELLLDVVVAEYRYFLLYLLFDDYLELAVACYVDPIPESTDRSKSVAEHE